MSADGTAALERIGFDGDRLLKLCHDVANTYMRRNGITLQNRYEDLVQFLAIQGVRAAISYDPTRIQSRYGCNGGGDAPSSYLWDVLEQRCTDWYRSKAEGNGDRRYGNDNRITYTEDPEPADHAVEFDRLVDERRRARWQLAADVTGWPLEEWIALSLDKVAKEQLPHEAVAA